MLYGCLSSVEIDDKDTFLTALENAGKGDTLYVKAEAVIDLTGLVDIILPEGVTITGRGADTENYTDYPLLFSEAVPERERINTLLLVGGDDVVIRGIRLRGAADWNNPKQIPGSVGVRNNGYAGTIITDCEISDWHFSGIFFDQGSRENYVTNNFIHNNSGEGYGYGVCIGQGSFANVEHNRFDYNRHDIAGGGHSDSGYTARYNRIGINGTSHSFDMHGGADRKDGTDYAGCCIIIENNEFHTLNHWAIAIRGMPKEFAIIKNNTFFGEKNFVRSNSVKQLNTYGRVYVGPNYYDYDYRLIEERGFVIDYADAEHTEWLLHTGYDVRNVRVGDFNGDGISDLFVIDGRGRWLVSWGALVSWQVLNDKVMNINSPDNLYIGDFNGNGCDDVLIIDEDNLYLSDKGSGELVLIEGMSGKPERIYVHDINGDGVSDIFYYDRGEWFSVINKLTETERYSMPFVGFREIVIADYGANIFWEEEGRVYYINEERSKETLNLNGGLEDIIFIDYTGDGNDEVFFADGERWYLLKFGADELEVIKESSIKRDRLLFGDFNGDGRTDIVYANK